MDLTTHFYDIHEINSDDRKVIKQSFVGGLAQFIVDHVEKCGDAIAIARSAYERMCGTHLHYHTPIHVLQMFDFARLHNIELKPCEELAIWYHDVIYHVGTGFGPSEHASMDFMAASLYPGYKEVVERAKGTILATAAHMEDNVNPEYTKVLDLDVNTFLTTGDMARELNDCLKKELCPKSDEGWLRGRSGFLETFLIKGFVFRSPEMKRLDQQAVSNIRDQIAECKQILRDEYSVEVLT